MDKMNFFRMAFVAFLTTATLASCDDDNEYVYYNPNAANALVTLKSADNGSFYMQLDDKTALWPVNVDKNPYGYRELRALINCYKVNYSGSETNPLAGAMPVHVNWIDSIRTKKALALENGSATDAYGKDPVEIVNDWVTVAEDGYLTLRFRTQWGGKGAVHYVNLLAGTNPDDPYEVVFCQDSKGDTKGHWGDALVAFKLPEAFNTAGKQVKLTLRYMSYTGEKKVQFDYQSGNVALEGSETQRAAYSSQVR